MRVPVTIWEILYEHQLVYNRFSRQAGCLGCDLVLRGIREDRDDLRKENANHQSELIEKFLHKE